MSTSAEILADISAAILIMEFVLHGIAMVIGMDGAVRPLTDHLGFRPGRPLGLAIGVVDLAAAALLVIGFPNHGAAAIAAGYAVAYFGLMMYLRFYRRLGTIIRPPDFPIFLASGVVLLLAWLA
jgi:uncharacterized membrane protein YphA (DoxX/SURF4 family)